jgi:hypothetical protein
VLVVERSMLIVKRQGLLRVEHLLIRGADLLTGEQSSFSGKRGSCSLMSGHVTSCLAVRQRFLLLP